ncbi:hypothetical protein GCM10010174_12410 [Kutzneria viridogrisea]|uniref:Secreted protein n=2 Tax=Kutzneria TaxID=43356 RepID=W5WSP2_9PSEU|nr:hypothetical protein [Kutzneria albida]AHI01155.1 hypothetical protein KALB_7797 [Kutzneria albida DSM 43870]MBA8926409.1 hypothetical protein [Kutzneria viridogrisea]
MAMATRMAALMGALLLVAPAAQASTADLVEGRCTAEGTAIHDTPSVGGQVNGTCGRGEQVVVYCQTTAGGVVYAEVAKETQGAANSYTGGYVRREQLILDPGVRLPECELSTRSR